MATYTDITIDQNTGIGSGKIDGILFSSVNLAEGYKEISQHKIAPKGSIFSPDSTSNKDLIINAVDIDWNGAQLLKSNLTTGNDTINTTGDLLNYIQTLRTKIADLSTDVNDLKTAFANIASNVGALITITNGETTNS